MTRAEFKKRWEGDSHGGGITFNDIADCAKSWGLFQRPKTAQINRVTFEVLKAAGTNDYLEYSFPETGRKI